MLPAAILVKLFHLLQKLRARKRPRDERIGPDPTVDPFQPVTNPDLLAAIDYHARFNTLETEEAMLLVMAKAVYVVAARRSPAAVIRADGVWVIPPGSGNRLLRPDIGNRSAVLAFTEEEALA